MGVGYLHNALSLAHRKARRPRVMAAVCVLAQKLNLRCALVPSLPIYQAYR